VKKYQNSLHKAICDQIKTGNEEFGLRWSKKELVGPFGMYCTDHFYSFFIQGDRFPSEHFCKLFFNFVSFYIAKTFGVHCSSPWFQRDITNTCDRSVLYIDVYLGARRPQDPLVEQITEGIQNCMSKDSFGREAWRFKTNKHTHILM
jgi:hypothetical protein